MKKKKSILAFLPLAKNSSNDNPVRASQPKKDKQKECCNSLHSQYLCSCAMVSKRVKSVRRERDKFAKKCEQIQVYTRLQQQQEQQKRR